MKTMQAEAKAMQAEYKTDIKDLAKQIAERDTRFIGWMAGLLALAVSIIGIIVSAN